MAMEAPGNARRMVCCNAQYSNAHHCTVRCHWVEVSCWSWQEIRHQVWRTAASRSSRGSQEDTGTPCAGPDMGGFRQRWVRWGAQSECREATPASHMAAVRAVTSLTMLRVTDGLTRLLSRKDKTSLRCWHGERSGTTLGAQSPGGWWWLCSDGAMLRESRERAVTSELSSAPAAQSSVKHSLSLRSVLTLHQRKWVSWAYLDTLLNSCIKTKSYFSKLCLYWHLANYHMVQGVRQKEKAARPDTCWIKFLYEKLFEPILREMEMNKK